MRHTARRMLGQTQTAIWHSIGLMLCLILSACASTPPQDAAVPVELSFKVVASVNPDLHGRPSPIVVRIYELKSAAHFEQATFFDLQDKDQIALAGDMVAREELVLRPGETRVVSRKGSIDGRFIGLLAGYRDLEHSIWRATVEAPSVAVMKRRWLGLGPMPSLDPVPIAVTIDRAAIRVAPQPK